MSTREAVYEFLREKSAPYTTLAYAPAFTAQEEAARAHVPGRDWAKTVVCLADGQPVLAVLPAPFSINFEKLRLLAGATAVRLATETEMQQLYPDCEVGATPPLGPLYQQRVFVDERLTREPEIVFHAGTHADAISMRYDIFVEAVRPMVGRFSEPPRL